MPGPFQHFDSPVSSSKTPYLVTPSDTLELPVYPKELYIGGTGNVVVRGSRATADVTFLAVPANDRGTPDVRPEPPVAASKRLLVRKSGRGMVD
jgi:hypothetical protein